MMPVLQCCGEGNMHTGRQTCSCDWHAVVFMQLACRPGYAAFQRWCAVSPVMLRAGSADVVWFAG